jgi:hypothetical protein
LPLVGDVHHGIDAFAFHLVNCGNIRKFAECAREIRRFDDRYI